MAHTEANRGGGVGGWSFVEVSRGITAPTGMRSPRGTGRDAELDAASTPAGKAAPRGMDGASSSQGRFSVGNGWGCRSRRRSRSTRSHAGQPHVPTGMPHLHTCSLDPPSSRTTGPSVAPKAAGTATTRSVTTAQATRAHCASARCAREGRRDWPTRDTALTYASLTDEMATGKRGRGVCNCTTTRADAALQTRMTRSFPALPRPLPIGRSGGGRGGPQAAKSSARGPGSVGCAARSRS